MAFSQCRRPPFSKRNSMISKIIFYDYVLAYFPARVRFLLYEKEIPFDHCNVDIFNAENLTLEFAKLNPAMTLPVMNLDGRIITQSMDICQGDSKP
jgi:glutathione S-transferase